MDLELQPVLQVLGSLLGGGSVTWGAMKFNVPGFREIKQLAISEEDAWERIIFGSPHAVAVVRTVQQAGQDLDYTIARVSDRAAPFYAASLEEIVGWTAKQELEQLGRYVEGEDFERFLADQAEVGKNLAAGRDAYAQVPLHFNAKHPHLPNESFLPIVVSFGKKLTTPRGEIVQDMTVMYLNVKRAIRGMNVGLGEDRLEDAEPE